jgi:hypothetical protein
MRRNRLQAVDALMVQGQRVPMRLRDLGIGRTRANGSDLTHRSSSRLTHSTPRSVTATAQPGPLITVDRSNRSTSRGSKALPRASTCSPGSNRASSRSIHRWKYSVSIAPQCSTHTRRAAVTCARSHGPEGAPSFLTRCSTGRAHQAHEGETPPREWPSRARLNQTPRENGAKGPD